MPRPRPNIIMNITGWLVGTATMPPVAAVPVMRYHGQTARNGQDRSLQTCREYRIIPEYCNKQIIAR